MTERRCYHESVTYFLLDVTEGKCAEGGDTTVAQSQGRLVMEVSSKGVSCNLS